MAGRTDDLIPTLLALVLVAGCDAKADAGGSADVAVAAAELPAIRVRVAAVDHGVLDVDASATGQLHPFKSARVAAEVPGRVLRRNVERGANVRRGAALFRLDRRTAALQYKQAVHNESVSAIDLDLAERELQRGEQLLAGEDIARSSYDQLAHSRDSARTRKELARVNRRLVSRSVSDAQVKAPFAGTVVELHAEVGDYVGPGSPLLTIADLSRLRLRVGLTASEALALQDTVQGTVTVRFDELGGVATEASLHDVSPLADPRSGTYTAEFWLEQTEGSPLRQGMVGRVNLSDSQPPERLLVPREAVIRSGGEFAVWVVAQAEGGQVARRRTVSLGRYDAVSTEVRDGLVSGEQVVVDGLFALADGARVEIDGGEG